ncbi:hypothetical protein BGW37DRAFT_242374 [Umbelopsis sp. PMI_123]|nr:hypothetical protein BGW37DRAFT_242374 [Umbelopsis sp. PMI_123]
MEYPHLGSHCSFANCHELDFLPHPCPLCTNTVCSGRIFKAPGMSQDKTLELHLQSRCCDYLYSSPAKGSKVPCCVEGCNDGDPMIGLVQCDACSSLFCLKHRYRTAHHCAADAKALKDKEDRKTAARLKIEEHLGKRPLEKKPTPSTIPRPKRLNPKLELMKMRARAKGDNAVPQESRIYFNVHFPESSKIVPVPLYFDKTQSIGRMLDRIAQIGNIPNNNHKLDAGDPKRLHLLALPDKTKLATEKTIEHVLNNGVDVMLEYGNSI